MDITSTSNKKQSYSFSSRSHTINRFINFRKTRRDVYLAEYLSCVDDLLLAPIVTRLDAFIQHGQVTRLEHSIHVSYGSFLACKKLGLDARSAARGGLLHDLYFYDWLPRGQKGWHLTCHPKDALENARKHFSLNKTEEEIIVSHMWPLGFIMPTHRESYVVSIFDKIAATAEVTRTFKRTRDRVLLHCLAANS